MDRFKQIAQAIEIGLHPATASQTIHEHQN
jgi:hypothetical protein